jgi:hypothetical protein
LVTLVSRNYSDWNAKKQMILKVTSTGSNKKQKTPIKEHVKEALKDWMEEADPSRGDNAKEDEHMELQEGGDASVALSPSADPSPLMGTHEEACQEQ